MLYHGYTCPPHRDDLLHVLPKGGVVAEFGAHRGDFAQQIWEINKPSRLYLIDHQPRCGEDMTDSRRQRYIIDDERV